jgi:hypothetical protein
LDNYLTPLQYLIIELLFRFRGAIAIQLAALIFGNKYTLSQEKSIYNYLGKLKELKLITSNRLQGNFSRGSIYYLTPKGYELAMEWLNIMENQKGDGWINEEAPLFADIDYSTFKPPLVQTTHHLLLINFFIELREIKESMIAYRLNLYASMNYETEEGTARYRPDAEIKFADGRLFAIEIDTGSESHEQFRQKFRTYRRYFDFLSKHDIESLPAGIMIVVDNRSRDYGIKRRWASIVSAFYKEIGNYHFKVNLIMTPLSSAKETLVFEDNRIKYEMEVGKYFRNAGTNDGYEIVNYTYKSGEFIQENAFSYVIKDNHYRVAFNATCQTFETQVYSRFIKQYPFLTENTNPKDVVKGLEYIGYSSLIYCIGNKPFLIESLPYDIFDFDSDFTKIFQKLSEGLIQYVSLKQILNI